VTGEQEADGAEAAATPAFPPDDLHDRREDRRGEKGGAEPSDLPRQSSRPEGPVLGGTLVVYFAGVGFDGVAGTDRRIVDELCARTPVLYVDPPRSLLTPLIHPHLAASLRGPALREVRPGLWWLTPRVLPGAQRPGMYRVTERLIARAARRAVAALGSPDTAVVVATYDDLLGAVPGSRSVLYVTDDLVAGADLLGLPRHRLRKAEARRAAEADAIAVVSPVLAARFRDHDTTLIPNGCTPPASTPTIFPTEPETVRHWIGAPPARLPEGFRDSPVAGFVGNINGRIDVPLLDSVAAVGHPLLLVGPAADPPSGFAELVARGNVCWVGKQPPESLETYLGLIDVGLTPYLVNDFNRASFPIKTLEYLGAGCGVVSTDLPATEWLRSDRGGADLIRVATTPTGFVKEVEAELAVPATPELVARRRTFAGRHTWARRAEALARLLEVA
jgi:teichuronic acid biosynthesis glycosyltransferase TuaH